MLADLAYQRLLAVNVVFGGMPGAADGEWVLSDAAVVGSVNAIRKAAARRFGARSRPAAIVMTHGHVDRVAVPEHGRSIDAPARPETGTA